MKWRIKREMNNMKPMTMCSAMFLLFGVALLGPIMTVSAAELNSPADGSANMSYEQSRRFEVGPFIGYTTFEKKQNLKDGFSYGGRLGYNVSKHFGVEGSLGMVRSHVKDKSKTGLQKDQYRSPVDGVDMNSYQLGAIYQFTPDRRFTPFVTAGFGSLRYSPQVLDNNRSTLDYGLGAKYWMRRDVALRIDVKDQMDSSFHNYSATFEVVFALGSRSKQPPTTLVKAEPQAHPEPTENPIITEPSPKVVEKQGRWTSEPKLEGQTIDLVFEDIHFNFDSSTLTEVAKEMLKKNIQILNDHPQTRVRIAGYTSASGSNRYNHRLSERRANAVQEYLLTKGAISQDRLTTIGYGESNPAEFEAAPNQKYSTSAKANMRVLFETIVQ